MPHNSYDVITRCIVNLFRIKKEIRGKVDLQKSIYFMKRFGICVPFEFRWNVLGPYSYELAHHCKYLEVDGLLQYTGVYKINEEKGKEYPTLDERKVEKISNFFQDINKICEKKAFDKVLFIECLASLDFIKRNVIKNSKEKKSIFSLLERLKPEKAIIFKNMLNDAWEILEKYFG